MQKLLPTILIAFTVLIMTNAQAQTPLGEEFSYQGELNDANGNPHDGVFDFKFVAFDAKDDGMGTNLGQFVAEDVTVTNGIFTTQIDYSLLGDQPFVGNKVWLEISVRIGTTTGGYQQLLPRQQVTATPYANYATIAEMVGSNAVGTNEIIDDSIGATDIGANAVGTSEIDSTQVQRRVTTTCTAGQFIQSVNQDGTAVCVAETTGLTTVSSADIVDGTIAAVDIDKTQVQKRVGTVCSGGRLMRSINVDGVATCIFPNTGADTVVSADIVDGTIVAVDVDTSQIQQRVGGSCDDGQYLNGINQDGSILCKKLPIGLSFTLDNSAAVGKHTSIAKGADGNPIISYYDEANEDLMVYKCSNSSCSAGTDYTLDGSTFLANTSVGQYTSITIGADNNPIISYYDQTNEDLKAYKCSNSSCSAGTAYTLDGNTPFANTSVGQYTSIAIGADDNNPIISYFDNTNGNLKAYKCGDISCSAGNAYTLHSSISTVGWYTSIAIGADDNPIISYYDAANGYLKVLKCTNSSCSLGNAFTLDNSSSFLGFYTSIAIGADDNPIISYFDSFNENLKVYSCGNTSCSN